MGDLDEMRGTPGSAWLVKICTAKSAPKAKGTKMPAALMANDDFPRPRSNLGSSSRPIRNMKNTSPTWLSSDSPGIDAFGNSC